MIATALGAGLAYASGGSDHDDEVDTIDTTDDDASSDDHSGRDDSDRDNLSDDDRSGSGGDTESDSVGDGGDSSGGDDDESSGGGSGGDDDVESSGGGADDDDDDSSGGDDDDDSAGGDDDDASSGDGGDDDSGDDDDDDDSSSDSGGDDDDNSGGSSGDDDDDDDNSGGGVSGSGSGGGDDDDDDDNTSGSPSNSSGSSHASGAGASEWSERSDAGSEHLIHIEHDGDGGERVAGEALFTGAKIELAAVRSAGFDVISQRPLASIGSAIARLRMPDRMGLDKAMNALHTLAPNALITANSIYRSSDASVAPARPGAARRAGAPDFIGVLGIIDTGVNASALSAPAGLLSQRAFAGNAPVAREHGALVAALAIDAGMRVHVADVFGRGADGGLAASAESIAAALDWMIVNNVPVINVSIEGPNNPVLAALVESAAQRGHVIVAAAGNGGPFAGPAFPAAFDGSVAVTAIDANDRPYMRANRGAYIAFAAPGVDLNVRSGGNDVVVSGTSFAAPLVAATIAERLHRPSLANARLVLESLQDQAIDLGAPGRDPIFGWGALRD